MKKLLIPSKQLIDALGWGARKAAQKNRSGSGTGRKNSWQRSGLGEGGVKIITWLIILAVIVLVPELIAILTHGGDDDL